MIITGNDKDEIQLLKKKLFNECEMKDLGKIKYFLGIEVIEISKGNFHMPEEVCSRPCN